MDRGVFKGNVQVERLIPVHARGRARSSDTTDTLYNLDISSNIPKILLPMDAEDSPWGGM